jgi:hypothetical protein
MISPSLENSWKRYRLIRIMKWSKLLSSIATTKPTKESILFPWAL